MGTGLSFFAPHALWLLLAVPLLVILYLAILRRRKLAVLRFTDIALIKEAVPGRSLIRHLPPALLLLGLTVALLAAAKPAAVITLPAEQSQVILAIDVSVSMRAADVEPDRITAAKNAAKTFIQDMPATTRIGVVAFAGNAMLAQAPTINKADLLAAIDRFRLQRATNIGGAILASLETIFPAVDFAMALPEYERGGRTRAGASLDEEPVSQPANLPAVPPGSYQSAVIILLTDGQSTTGPDPVAAARVAADRGVRVFTVGLGSEKGEVAGFGGRRLRVQIDEETLKTIADLTRGRYFFADSTISLAEIYKQMNTQLVMERQLAEVSFLFAAVAALLIGGACALSLALFHRTV